jgi:hypothetical protein
MLLVYIHRTRSDFVLSARSTYTCESTFFFFFKDFPLCMTFPVRCMTTAVERINAYCILISGFPYERQTSI